MDNLTKWQRALALFSLIKQALVIAQDLIPGKENGGESGRGGDRLAAFFELFEDMARDVGESVEEIRPQVERLVAWSVRALNKLSGWRRAFAEVLGKDVA